MSDDNYRNVQHQLEAMRQRLAHDEDQAAAVNIHLPTCRTCGAPLGMSPATGRNPGADLRCLMCTRTRKQQRHQARKANR
jgi:hypothetical protein